MNSFKLIGAAVVLSLAQVSVVLAGEIDPASVPKPKQTVAKKYLSAKEAAAMKQQLGNEVLMIDVRTPAEVEYVGIADVVDANVPYMLDDYGMWDDKNSRFMGSPNSAFLVKMSEVIKGHKLNKSSPVIVICRSGDRSARAADLLTQSGYENAYTVADGFEGDLAKEGPNKGKRAVNGWKNSGLTWGYKLDKEKMYIE